MVSERLKQIRERLQRREKKVRAKRQAKERRIEKGDPKNLRESARSKGRSAKQEAEMTASEARELASDAKTLISTELGVPARKAEGVISQGADIIESAGDGIKKLDGDGDGDTDLLNSLEIGLEQDRQSGGGSGGAGPVDLSETGDLGIVDEAGADPFGADDTGNDQTDPFGNL